MPSLAYEQRTELVTERLAESDAEGIILSMGDDQQYLTGNTERQAQPRHTFFILRQDGKHLFFIPENNAPNVLEDTWVENVITWADDQDPLKELEHVLEEFGFDEDSTILVNDNMWALFVRDLQQLLNTRVNLASEIMTELRMQKDEAELEKMRQACQISDEVSKEIRSLDGVGMTEKELVAEIEYRIKKKGADVGFNTMVASGPNSGKPSYRQGTREINPSDPVVLDFGAEIDGYTSDQTRVVVYEGTPPDRFRDAFDAVCEAKQAAIDFIEPGVVAKEVDEVARGTLESRGYGENFLHVTGHGIGLNIHEPPFLMSGNYLGDGNLITLREGMVVTVEPGVYTDKWGIRIEDDVVVTEDGCKKLTNTTQQWQPLGK